MTPDASDWSLYRPDALPELAALAGAEGRLIAVLATDEAIAHGWATEISLGLARGWSRAGVPVTLIDADLNAPALHRALDIQNEIGLTDALLFRSSLAGVSYVVEGGRFQFVSAGLFAVEPELAFQGGRWPALCKHVVRAESTLLVFVPNTAPWSSAILNQATDVIVLATASDEVAPELRLDKRVRAVMRMSGAEPDDTLADVDAAGDGDTLELGAWPPAPASAQEKLWPPAGEVGTWDYEAQAGDEDAPFADEGPHVEEKDAPIADGGPHVENEDAHEDERPQAEDDEAHPFGAEDGERVRVVLLLVSPEARTDEHLAAMKAIVTIARDAYQRQRLLGCRSAESFLDLLAEIGGQKV